MLSMFARNWHCKSFAFSKLFNLDFVLFFFSFKSSEIQCPPQCVEFGFCAPGIGTGESGIPPALPAPAPGPAPATPPAAPA